MTIVRERKNKKEKKREKRVLFDGKAFGVQAAAA